MVSGTGSISITITDDGDAWQNFEKYTHFKIIDDQLNLYSLNDSYNPGIVDCDMILHRVKNLNPALE